MKDKIITFIIESLKEINEELQNPELVKPTAKTHLYGKQGNLDSLALIRLIIDVEGKILDELGKEITIADERAMSQRLSPFRRVESLANYIIRLLNEEVRL
jgi:acyl carrier protein